MISREIPIIRYNRGDVQSLNDPVIEENWIDLYLNGRFLTGTPVIDKELDEFVYGFLFMEGYLKPGERIKIARKPDGIYAELSREVEIRTVKELVDCAYSKIVFKEDIKKVELARQIEAETVVSLMHEFQKLPSVYHETGGVHMAAFAGVSGIEYWSDDISRRNAVDKTIGKLFLDNRSIPEGIMLSSGRISSDIVLRLIRLNIPVILSVSAPTVKGVELAREYGITVCGFARGKRFNIYSHPDRIIF